ncbi:MAG: cyclic nucleotide-binding domain-containing protein [Anaerolineae bacterium]
MSIFDILQANPYFKNLTNDDLNILAKSLTLSKHDDGTIFIEEGETDNTVYLLVEGVVVVSQRINGEETTLQKLENGSFFGLLALLNNDKRIATCRAQGEVVVATINADNYQALAASFARIGLAFQRALGAQIASDYRNVSQTISEMLNAEPDQQTNDMTVDVAVIGSGPLGMFYAMWVKRFHPDVNIVLLDRRSQPVHKVGESTLSTTVRAFNAMGLTLPVMRRMFGNKAGLRWFHARKSDDVPQEQFDIIDIEETYQVERRVLETAMQHLMRTREGLNIMTGVQVFVRKSDLEGQIKHLACQNTEGDPFTIHAKMVCDASGPASVLPRHFGTYRKAPELHDTFSYNSYFAYFRQIKPLPIDNWDYPATRHICFEEGWLWFISLISWDDNTHEQIESMVKYLLEHDNPTDEGLPTREALAEMFDMSYEPIFSVGFTIRTDRDVDGMSIKDRFNHWVQQYPSIKWVLDHFELIEAPYEGKARSHFAFMDMLHDTTAPAGDGWCAIGDAAIFINPFLSLGLNYGTGTAYMAAKDTAAALKTGDFSQAAFTKYRDYIAAIFEQKVRETDMYYRSFNHPLSYERVLALTICNGILDVLPRDGYSDSDPYVFNPLAPDWVQVTKEIVKVQREGEMNDTDPAAVAQDVARIVEDYIKHLRQTTTLNEVPMSHYMTFYDDRGERLATSNEQKGRGDYQAVQCSCNLFYDDTLANCPYCGEENLQPYVMAPNEA